MPEENEEKKIIPCLQFILTTKAILATEKATDWLQENWDIMLHDEEHKPKITPFMSFAGKEGCQVGCMIEYYILE